MCQEYFLICEQGHVMDGAVCQFRSRGVSFTCFERSGSACHDEQGSLCLAESGTVLGT